MLSSSNIGTCRGNRGFTACAVKNNLRSGVHTDRNVLDLNCHFYVVKATLEKGAEKMYQASPPSPTSKDFYYELDSKVEATGRENTPPGHLIVQMKRGKQNLERVYFYLRFCVFPFVSSSFKINRMAVSIFVKNNRPARPPTFYWSFFIFMEG